MMEDSLKRQLADDAPYPTAGNDVQNLLRGASADIGRMMTLLVPRR